MTPAELSKVLFENFSNYQSSIQKIKNISDEKERLSLIKEETIKSIEYNTIINSDDYSEIETETESISVETKKDNTEDSSDLNDNKLKDLNIVTKNSFVEDVTINENTFTKDELNKKLQNYAFEIESELVKKHANIWNSMSLDIKTRNNLKHNYVSLLNEKIFEKPIFLEYTKYRYNEEKINKVFKYPMHCIEKVFKDADRIYGESVSRLINTIEDELQFFSILSKISDFKSADFTAQNSLGFSEYR